MKEAMHCVWEIEPIEPSLPITKKSHGFSSTSSAKTNQSLKHSFFCYAFLENKLCHMTSVTSTQKKLSQPQRRNAGLDPSTNPISWSPGFSSQVTSSIAFENLEKKQTYRLLKIFPSKSTNACSCVFQRLSTCLCLVISKRNLFISILMLISKDICIYSL